MTKKFIAGFVFVFFCIAAFSQDLPNFHLYKPGENAEIKISEAVKQARAAGKNVFIQVGGNWCIWCARFNDFITADQKIDSIVNAGFVVYHLNFSKENKNVSLLAKYGFPQRFGFPVFLILDQHGNRLHTQDSSLLEAGKSYDKEKVEGFLNNWTPTAVDPKQYKE